MNLRIPYLQRGDCDIDIPILASDLLQIPVQALFRVDGQSRAFVQVTSHISSCHEQPPSQPPVRQPKC